MLFLNNIRGQVINDNPCDTLPGGPLDLSVVPNHKGTTCGAIGYADDTLADFPNYYCNKLTEENAVWYKYKFKPGSEGIQIDVLPLTKKGKPAIEIFFGNTGFGCADTLKNFIAGHCDSLPAKFRFGSCSYIGDIALIKIASTEAKCDSFQIKVKEIQRPCNVAEKCNNITSDHILSPITGDDLNYVCIKGCLDLACPEDSAPEGCDFSKTATVWYYIETGELASQLFTTCESNSGSWQPIWSIYYGDCANLINAATGNAPPCSNGDASADLHQVVADNTVDGFYVAITYDPNDPPTEGDAEFEFCAATIGQIPEIEVFVNLKESEICSGESINLELRKIIEDDYSIFVYSIDNPAVDGEKNHTFTGSYGIVNDTLRISNKEINSPQIVRYIIYAETPELSYYIAYKFVTVFPAPWIEKLVISPEFCSTSLPKTLKINGHSAYPGTLSYNWTDDVSGLTSNDSLIIIDESFSPGVHNFIINLTDKLGCSAIDTVFLKIIDFDTSITKSGNTLGCIQSNAQYQWLNCYAGYAKIIGETAQSFTPIVNGSYAVEIKKDGCIDTSFCHNIIITGIIENTFGEKFKIFPNPTNGKVEIEIGEILPEIEISVTDINEKKLSKKQFKNSSSLHLELESNKGVYIINIRAGGKYAIVKVVKQ